MGYRKTKAQYARNAPKGAPGKKSRHAIQKRVPVSVIFCVFLLIAIVAIFFILVPKVNQGVFNILKKQESQSPDYSPQREPPNLPPPSPETQRQPSQEPSVQEPLAQEPLVQEPLVQEPSVQELLAQQPGSQPPASQTRIQRIYFMQQEKSGAEFTLVTVNRELNASITPLRDSLNALLAGITAEEKARGLRNCISENTRIIWVRMEGNTALINFSEDLQYNKDGREGIMAQLKQIVWTATEIPNVHNVQIFIDGEIKDFISEGVRIGSPLSRSDTFY